MPALLSKQGMNRFTKEEERLQTDEDSDDFDLDEVIDQEENSEVQILSNVRSKPTDHLDFT